MQIGVTDLSITTGDGKTYNFEVRVTADMNPLRAQLLKAFPDARVRLSQMRDHVVVEGQARDGAQVTRIMETISAYLDSILASQERRITQTGAKTPEAKGPAKKDEQPPPPVGPLAPGLKIDSKIAQPKIINLLRVPGAQQVLLKVKVAELDRTAFRQIGADLIAGSKQNGAIFGTNTSGLGPRPTLKATNAGLVGLTEVFAGGPTTVFGIFENADFAFFLSALRRNELLRILAEPNLVALNGHQATFLAGGEFPIPVPQSGAGGGPATITIQFKKFGVSLAFKPDILDGDRIRMSVDPEVSSIDFAIGTAISGTVVPGLNTRNAHTVVEMKEGQTLAMAGLLSVTLEGTTNRIPGLGDVPVLGPLFSNTTNKRQEKELIVLVTPYLVDALNCDQVPPSPGAEVGTPNDLEFYVGNRIESKTGRDWRATTGNYAAPPVPVPAFLKLHTEYIRGPHGFVD
jgi:pilus assembly protein CpaC